MRLRVEMSEWSEKDVHVLHDVLMPPKNDTLVHVHVRTCMSCSHKCKNEQRSARCNVYGNVGIHSITADFILF